MIFAIHLSFTNALILLNNFCDISRRIGKKVDDDIYVGLLLTLEMHFKALRAPWLRIDRT